MLVETVDGGNIRVVQGTQKAGFPLKAGSALRIPGQFGRQQLDGDRPSQVDILGSPNLSHAALTDLLDDAVVGDDLVRLEGQGDVLIAGPRDRQKPPQSNTAMDEGCRVGSGDTVLRNRRLMPAQAKGRARRGCHRQVTL